MFDISNLWTPKFKLLPTDQVATYGSCFAQHIGHSLREHGYQWLIKENAPVGLSDDSAKGAGYGLFSSRTANIYTASLLLQWLSWASGKSQPPQEVWEQNGRFYDPFRPAIEPGGFGSNQELHQLREHTISCFKESIIDSDYFVFTMGLTESWWNTNGYEYPMCPGTVAGAYDKNTHRFTNQNYSFVLKSMNQAMDLAKKLNPKLKFILTVSPVPLTATNSNNHVLVATMESKSILRAVAGELTNSRDDCDYFPSYEIINSPAFGGIFFEPNKRSVNPVGVKFVMNSFFSALDRTNIKIAQSKCTNGTPKDNIITDFENGCEEAMLELYSGKHQ